MKSCRRPLPLRGDPFLLLLVLSTGACSPHDDGEANAASESDLVGRAEDPPVTTEPDLRAAFDDVRARIVPELAGYRVELEAMDRDPNATSFFQANARFLTAILPARDRTYRVQYNPWILEHPLPKSAVVAVFTHELGHIVGYTKMSSLELAAFGVWYETHSDEGGVASYERQTDLFALEHGQGRGLIRHRRWWYPLLDPEALKAKKRDYYTVEEINAFLAAHPSLDSDRSERPTRS